MLAATTLLRRIGPTCDVEIGIQWAKWIHVLYIQLTYVSLFQLEEAVIIAEWQTLTFKIVDKCMNDVCLSCALRVFTYIGGIHNMIVCSTLLIPF